MYVIVNLLFYHFLLVEGSQYFNSKLLILQVVFIGVYFFGLQKLFEGWCSFYLHQIEH